jgi:hypothetical protein
MYAATAVLNAALSVWQMFVGEFVGFLVLGDLVVGEFVGFLVLGDLVVGEQVVTAHQFCLVPLGRITGVA